MYHWFGFITSNLKQITMGWRQLSLQTVRTKIREKYKIYKNTCSSLFIQKLSKESVTINGCIFEFLNYFSLKKVIDYLTSDNDFGMESLE